MEQLLTGLTIIVVLGIGAQWLSWRRARHGESALPLFAIKDTGEMLVFTASTPPAIKSGYTLISMVDPAE